MTGKIRAAFCCHGRAVKSLINQGIMGKTGHSLVVRAFVDYGNNTNEGMQMSRCRNADFNGSSNR